jgi:hypothetical protein
MFNYDQNEVHPLVSFLKDRHNLTWKDFANLLSERTKQLKKIKLSPSNVRNYAIGESKSWWFWPEIASMVMECWQEDRKKAKNMDEGIEIDLFYAGMFGAEMNAVYGFLYSFGKIEDTENGSRTNIESALSDAMSLVNAFINKAEAYYQILLPDPFKASDFEHK